MTSEVQKILAPYKPGQVWERDGKRREITEIDDGGYVWWRRLPIGTSRPCWCSTWLDWVSKARLVEDAE